MELSLLRDRGSSPCKPADQQGWLMRWERTKLTGHWWHSLGAHLQAGHAGVLTIGISCWLVTAGTASMHTCTPVRSKRRQPD